jgi:2-amino-4-hydroxy-6-hydroxymethyldihydropteridine diphosphokinase
MSPITYIALGSNLGDRQTNLELAIASLPPLIQPLQNSSIYETLPWGYMEQPAFLNQVLKAETELAPNQLLDHLKEIEYKLGRRPSVQYGPRLIDLDILFYNNLILDTPSLTIPHPHLHERAFVLVPLAEISLDFHHPVIDQSVRQLLTNIDTSSVTKLNCDKK